MDSYDDNNWDQSKKNRLRRMSIPAIAFFSVFFLFFLFVEGGARLFFIYKDDIGRLPIFSSVLKQNLHLDPFEIPSRENGNHWVLRPNFSANNKVLLTALYEKSKSISAQVLEDARGSPNWDKELFRINSQGFKGAEIDMADPRPRVLVLGDSVTFGTGPYDYPQEIDASLDDAGIDAVVINGGVQGYTSRNLLYEMKRYEAVEPKVVLISIGWNSLFSKNPFTGALENNLKIFWVAQRAYRAIRGFFGKSAQDAQALYDKPIYYDPKASYLNELDKYVPPALDTVAELVDELRKSGTEPVLMTLVGLFVENAQPTRRALRIGHLPQFTDNAFVLAKLTSRWNDGLMSLAREKNVPVIDLAAWSDEALEPRDRYFTDSVHLMPIAMTKIGDEVSLQLPRLIGLK